MLALHQEILPPSGVEFATCLRLTHSTASGRDQLQDGTNGGSPRVICNLVVARSNFLRIYEVREEPQPISAGAEEERERRAKVRKGTESFEGEVEMDDGGEGFVGVSATLQLNSKVTYILRFCLVYLRFACNPIHLDLDSVGTRAHYEHPHSFQSNQKQGSTVTRFYLVREHVLHGTVTGVEKLRTLASAEDKLDRLLVSFKDAKVRVCLLSLACCG